MPGLKDQFESDFEDIMADPDEFGTRPDGMTFEIVVNKQPHTFVAKVVWDTDTLKNRPIVQQQGVYLGEVLLFIAMRYFPVRPKAEQILYRIRREMRPPTREGWRILDVVDAESVYEISLDRLSS